MSESFSLEETWLDPRHQDSSPCGTLPCRATQP